MLQSSTPVIGRPGCELFARGILVEQVECAHGQHLVQEVLLRQGDGDKLVRPQLPTVLAGDADAATGGVVMQERHVAGRPTPLLGL